MSRESRIYTRPYVGTLKGTSTKEVFRSAVTPTEESHGDRYSAVLGPFHTTRGARAVATGAVLYFNTITQAERMAESQGGK